MRPIRPVARRPLTVIGGFLGAGKTTLLNRLLAGAHGRCAVLVNDFGAVNVDAGLIADHDGRTMRLTNGCVCCSLADGFLDTLLRVLDGAFDHIVVEASGVGDPAAIADIALIEPDLSLHGILVLADAERLPAQLADPRLSDTVARQIRAADILVLNKRDLVDADGLLRARAAIFDLRPDLPVIEAEHACVPDAVLALDGRQPSGPARSRLRAEPADHAALFRPVLYRRAGAFDRDGLARALADAPVPLLRLKGPVRLAGDGAQVLQMVGRRWSLTPLDRAGDWPIELVGIAFAEAEADLAALLDGALLAHAHGDRRCD